jgi:hypothetical protein
MIDIPFFIIHNSFPFFLNFSSLCIIFFYSLKEEIALFSIKEQVTVVITKQEFQYKKFFFPLIIKAVRAGKPLHVQLLF